MNLPLYLARHIYGQHDDRKKVSRPAIIIATAGVAVGVAVMIVSLAVVLGFKHTIRDKVVGFGSHIQVLNVQAVGTDTTQPVCMDDTLTHLLQGVDGVSHVERFTMAQGILKTDDDFLGVMFKGLGPEYDTRFLSDCMVSGELPQFCDTATTYPLVLSRTMADKLRLAPGSEVFAYFIGSDNVRARKFHVTGVYETNMRRFDDYICLTDLYVANRLNGWFDGQCSGAELAIDDFDCLDDVDMSLLDVLRDHRYDSNGNMVTSLTIRQAYPQVFQWLSLLDNNVRIILALMIALASFTMIGGLLIIILERTQMIGLLKAMGARNSTIRHTFLWFAALIIGRGLLWGNVAGIGIVLIQKFTGLVTLDPQTYYVSEAPMELNITHILLLNVGTLVICTLVLVVPSFLVSRIHPARSMRYE